MSRPRFRFPFIFISWRVLHAAGLDAVCTATRAAGLETAGATPWGAPTAAFEGQAVTQGLEGNEAVHLGSCSQVSTGNPQLREAPHEG